MRFYIYYHYIYYSQVDEREKHGYIFETTLYSAQEAKDFIDKADKHIDHNREWYSMETEPLPPLHISQDKDTLQGGNDE